MKEITDSDTRQYVRNIAGILRNDIAILAERRKTGMSTFATSSMLGDLINVLDQLNQLNGDVESFYRNYYRCDNGHKIVEWDDEWSCQCDDECPQCGIAISPYASDDLIKQF
jgi:hypothetical protein